MTTRSAPVMLLALGGCAAAPAVPGIVAGTFAGDLVAHTDGAVRALTRMQLDIGPLRPDGRRRFCITYGAGGHAQVRDYELAIVDAAAGRHAIDERNGIVLDAVWVDGALVCAFAAGEQMLATRYRFAVDTIHFELETFARGGTVPPDVTPLRPLAVQRALLRRVR